MYRVISKKYYPVAEKILKEDRVEHKIKEKCLHGIAGEQDLGNFRFFSKYMDDKVFIWKHSKEMFRITTEFMNDEVFSYFHREFIKFVAEELIKSLGIEYVLKEEIRASISLGGYHCCAHNFFDAVGFAFPMLKSKISGNELLKEFGQEESCFLDETKDGYFILYEENTKKCIGEVLSRANIDIYSYGYEYFFNYSKKSLEMLYRS